VEYVIGIPTKADLSKDLMFLSAIFHKLQSGVRPIPTPVQRVPNNGKLRCFGVAIGIGIEIE
jgi:hypothetical protein